MIMGVVKLLYELPYLLSIAAKCYEKSFKSKEIKNDINLPG